MKKRYKLKKSLFFEDFLKKDNDGFPDFIKVALGLDKNSSEENRCQKNLCEFNLQTNSQKKMFLLF